MTAPISVDPSALAATGVTVAGDGDGISAAIGSLDSALSGAGAMFGHDAAGVVFAQSYTASGKALLDAAASAVNACRRVGFGVQMSAANYGHANASSTVGGGTSSVLVPTTPGQFNAPGMPPPLGAGIAAPMGWALVEGFVGDVWPDGNPGELRAAAGAWESFSTAVSGLVGQVNAEGPGLGAQQIPEAGQMVDAVGEIAGGLSEIASQAKTLAKSVEGFADAVDSTQTAVRGLLDQLSLSGVLETIGGIFTGDNPIDKVREVAHEIKTVLDNMKREADASSTLFSQGINMLDSATSSLQKWADKEFTDALGQEVGGALSAAFSWEVDTSEGGLKFVSETAQGIQQLDPTRFAYDPSGAAQTWQGMLESAAVVTNPSLLASTIAADPQGSLDTLKSVTDWKDVEAGHPGRAVGYDAAQLGSLFIPGLGEAEPAIDGAGVAGRAASAEERAAAGAARDGVPGFSAASSASESIATRAGRVGSELDGIKVPESAPPGAAPGASAPTGRAPVDAAPAEAPRPEAPAPRVPESAPGSPTTEPSSAPASDSAPPTAPHSAEPSRAHADPPPSHGLEPAQIVDSDSSRPPTGRGVYESAPPAGESSRPLVDSAPAGPGSLSTDVAPALGGDDKVPVSVGAHGAESSEEAAGGSNHGSGGGSDGGSGHGSGGSSGHGPSGSESHGDQRPLHNSGDGDARDRDSDPTRPGHDDDSGGSHENRNGDHGGSPWDHTALTDEQREEILATDKGSRPDPSEYLPKEFIEHHLAKFGDGACRFMTSEALEDYGIGHMDGTSFMFPSRELESLMQSTGGDRSALEDALGLPPGYFDTEGLVRVDVADPGSYGLRVPSGNEAGASEYWIPGGFLPKGMPEAVIDGADVPPGDIIIIDIDRE